MSDLLKEAIADAKAVRETALLNAKAALEEAFTPQLKSMLSAKLKEDEFEDEEDALGGEEEFGGEEEEEEIPAEEGYYEDEIPGDEEVPDEEIPGEEIPGEEEFGDEEDVEEEGYQLDLEDIIRELEQEIREEEGLGEGEESSDDTVEEGEESSDDTVEEGEESSDDTVEEGDKESDETVTEEDELDETKEEVDEEVDETSGIGQGENTVGKTDRSSDIGKAKNEQVRALQSQLYEYKEAVSFLKDKLHEVNILNAKLLFTNKLFKEYSLNNNQKLKVVETFDRAQTTREIKLVYSTLAEQFGDNSSIKRKSINESASSTVGSTKPSTEATKVISEETEVVDRFKKLAGLING
tara:strand:- start:1063 stop:2121 length:1059 start_codon:yes stop_codon:yes gene_type:complete